MTKTAAALIVLLAGMWSGGCDCSPAGPSGTPSLFSGSLAGNGAAFHDLDVPAETDSVNVQVQWTPAEAQVQLIQIDASCDPTQAASCLLDRLQQPRPGESPTWIEGRLNHQGPRALGRVRFVIQNLTAEIGVTYWVTATPIRHGCE